MSGLIGLGGYGSDSDDESGSGSPSSQLSKSPKQMEVDQDVVHVDDDIQMNEEDLVNADAAAEFSSELRRMSRCVKTTMMRQKRLINRTQNTLYSSF